MWERLNEHFMQSSRETVLPYKNLTHGSLFICLAVFQMMSLLQLFFLNYTYIHTYIFIFLSASNNWASSDFSVTWWRDQRGVCWPLLWHFLCWGFVEKKNQDKRWGCDIALLVHSSVSHFTWQQKRFADIHLSPHPGSLCSWTIRKSRINWSFYLNQVAEWHVWFL